MDMNKFIEHSPELYDLAREVAQVYRNTLRDRGAVASGDLKNFKYDVEPTEKGLDVIFKLPKHWKWIEYGRPPTTDKPDRGPKRLIDIIKEWMDMKGITPYKMSRDNFAKFITKRIHKHGYEPRYPLKQALDMSKHQQERMLELVNEIMLEDIKKEEI